MNSKPNHIVCPNFLSSDEVDELVRYAKGVDSGYRTNRGGNTFCTVVWIDHDHLGFQNLTAHINEYIQEQNATHFQISNIAPFTGRYQYTDYHEPSDAYGWHSDYSEEIDYLSLRRLTLTITLSDGDEYEGGGFELSDHEGHTAEPNPGAVYESMLSLNEIEQQQLRQKGTLTIFPANRMHKALPMLSGSRKVLVCWISCFTTPRTFLDFLEIGTSDFDALIQNADKEDFGISVDPVKYYLDRLPDLPGCKKINMGISDHNGDLDVYYIHPDDIKKNNLPDWIRGCNSVGNPHKTVIRILNERNIDLSLIRSERVKVSTLYSLMNEIGVTGIYQLKVSAEGHDVAILRKFFSEAPVEYFPHQLIFQTNSLSNIDDVHEFIIQLIHIGYEIIRCEIGGGASDTCMQLNIKKVSSKGKFSDSVPGYYLAGYPDNYNFSDPPHLNTINAAMDYCRSINAGGITYQYGRYEVREGRYLKKQKGVPKLMSWVMT